MPLLFLETIGENPLGKKNNYLKENTDKNPYLFETYEEIMKYVDSNRNLFVVEECFLYEHLKFLLKISK